MDLDRQTPEGRLVVVGWREDTLEAAAELALEVAHGELPIGHLIDFDGGRAYLKADRIRGKARVRHALRHALGRRRYPRVNEYYNLCWLTERLFQTPLPHAAGTLATEGLVDFQFLITEEVPHARALDDWLSEHTAPGERSGERARLLDELARETARMHALGFCHHDLYPRNVLVAPANHLRRIFFIDAWAGGEAPQLRGAEYDLACLMLDGAQLLEAPEQRRFFELYCTERAAQGRPVDSGRLVASVRAARERLATRLIARGNKRPGELRGRPSPERDWTL